MQSSARTPDEYVRSLPDDRKPVVEKLRALLRDNLPDELEETMIYGMIGYVVPLSVFPDGYHVNPSQPLAIVNLASQKNHVALYHMAVYMFPEVSAWFAEEYAKVVDTKLDMGKSCIRFHNMKKIPYGLIAELCGKIRLDEYLSEYKDILRS